MSMSISRRAFIQWLPDLPSEPTSTLVLTAPSGRFVDIRLLKHALINHNGDERLDASALDWAFAGLSQSRQLDDKPSWEADAETLNVYQHFASNTKVPATTQEERLSHTIWEHTIDSTTEHAELVKDEGDLWYNASLGLTLEKGRMQNPITGMQTDYLEGWLDEDVLSVPETPDCIVWEMENTAAQAKGILIKLGRYMQGVVRLGNHFSLVRLRWLEETSWKVEALMGHMSIPYHAITSKDMRLGDTFKVQTSFDAVWEWKIVEIE